MKTNKYFYIAYGSNMSRAQMKIRCPHAQFVASGVLEGFRLEFFLHATIVPAFDEKTPVAVFLVTGEDICNLDYYEGYPNYYTTKTVKVKLNNGKEVEGFVYIMNKIREPYTPQSAYFNGIKCSYRLLGFQKEIKSILKPARMRAFKHDCKIKENA